MDNPAETKRPTTFTDFLRNTFSKVLDPIAGFFNSIGLTPNTITLIGLVGNIVAAVLLALGQIAWGGVLVLLMAPLDAIDGAMARQRNAVTRFGGFLDSIIDRYSELFIFGGLLVYFALRSDVPGIILAYLSAAGSVLVSYIRARGESAGYQVKGGLLTRVERYLILVPCLLISRPIIALWALAVLANFTAIQRIFLVRAKAKADQDIVSS